MNQKDYKEIAKIIEATRPFMKYEHLFNLAHRLADYFEKEDFELFRLGEAHKFNKEQFLKDCGAKE